MDALTGTATAMTDTGDRALLDAVRRGDAGAFSTIFDRHHVAVFWQAYAVLRDADEAQDVAQEVFITCWRRRDDIALPDGSESLLPWLLVTARLTAQNARRKTARRQLRSVPLDEDPPDAASGPEREVDERAMRDAIDEAVAALPDVDRRLFDLCVEGDRTYEQAALELGVSHGVVRNRVSRLRKRLRGDLGDVREEA